MFVCALQDSSSCLCDCKQSSKDYKGSILLDTHTNEILITHSQGMTSILDFLPLWVSAGLGKQNSGKLESNTCYIERSEISKHKI